MEIDALIEAERQKPQMVQFRNQLSWVSGPWGIAQDMADELLRTIDVSVLSEMVRKQDRHWKFRLLEHQPDLSPNERASALNRYLKSCLLQVLGPQEEKRQQQEFPNTIWDAEEYHRLEATGAFNPDNESWDDDEDVVRHAPTPPESMRTSPSPHQQSSYVQTLPQVTSIQGPPVDVEGTRISSVPDVSVLECKLMHRLAYQQTRRLLE